MRRLPPNVVLIAFAAAVLVLPAASAASAQSASRAGGPATAQIGATYYVVGKLAMHFEYTLRTPSGLTHYLVGFQAANVPPKAGCVRKPDPLHCAGFSTAFGNSASGGVVVPANFTGLGVKTGAAACHKQARKRLSVKVYWDIERGKVSDLYWAFTDGQAINIGFPDLCDLPELPPSPDPSHLRVSSIPALTAGKAFSVSEHYVGKDRDGVPIVYSFSATLVPVPAR